MLFPVKNKVQNISGPQSQVIHVKLKSTVNSECLCTLMPSVWEAFMDGWMEQICIDSYLHL